MFTSAPDIFSNAQSGGTAVGTTYDNTSSSLVATNVQAAIDEVAGLSAGVASWGAITGTLANQTDLNNALNARLLASSNLSDVSNAATARTNLGLAIGTDVQAHSTVLDNTTASYTTAEETKLAGIEANADVTDTANVTAAGALMDSELTDLAGIKSLDTSTLFSGDYNDLTNQPTLFSGDYDDLTNKPTIPDTEAIEDIVGDMVSGNTETLITVTYQDGDGTLDFVVDNDLANYNNSLGWTDNAGTVTSVAVSGSDGIEVDSGSPITGAGTFNLGINAANLRSHINVEDGATANDTDANLLNRANHTGTQAQSTVTNLTSDLAAKLENISEDTTPQLGGNLDAQGNAIDNYELTVETETGTTYTMQASDRGKVKRFTNGSAITITVPDSLPVGFVCTIIQRGAGQITFSASGSMTLRNRQSHDKTAGQYAKVSLDVDVANECIIGGDTDS